MKIEFELSIDTKGETCEMEVYGIATDGQKLILDTALYRWPISNGDWRTEEDVMRRFVRAEGPATG